MKMLIYVLILSTSLLFASSFKIGLDNHPYFQVLSISNNIELDISIINENRTQRLGVEFGYAILSNSTGDFAIQDPDKYSDINFGETKYLTINLSKKNPLFHPFFIGVEIAFVEYTAINTPIKNEFEELSVNQKFITIGPNIIFEKEVYQDVIFDVCFGLKIDPVNPSNSFSEIGLFMPHSLFNLEIGIGYEF